jgi:hypothetical protein
VRPFTKLAIGCLLGLILAAAAFQLLLANRDQERYPGPAPGTPYPSVDTTP